MKFQTEFCTGDQVWALVDNSIKLVVIQSVTIQSFIDSEPYKPSIVYVADTVDGERRIERKEDGLFYNPEQCAEALLEDVRGKHLSLIS